MGRGRWLLCVAVAALLAGCDRESRPLQSQVEAGPTAVTVSDLRPGGGAPSPPDPRGPNYEGNAFQIAQGQRYFAWFNCNGCHANGGGGMGPALMDAKWRYGGSIDHIYASIAQGRPNGMPSFGDRIPDQQIWQLAAFVRSLSGNADKLAAPSRADAARSIPPINNINRQPPKGSDDTGGAR